MLRRFHLVPERNGQTDGQICYKLSMCYGIVYCYYGTRRYEQSLLLF